ncbi:MATE family efflux transporter [Salibacter sp.]|uniref:MATE family efflux transporter n=1 Tax=Salibacter sp. TaxID=2010995 RepID=UPI00287021F8|nr:MATE family efflux transporter [Salibacter sp.]MDR9397483.1 MATE family efflux transporter [Salibacter sp.]MDR9486717.1 MATE family efflux transporter [Salibacter sp.]
MKRSTWHRIKTWRLAYPVMLSQFGQIMVATADSIMVGRVGTIPLAASTLANSIFLIVFVFGIGISYAVSPLVANADGEKNTKRISSLLKHAVYINAALGLVLTGIVLIFNFNLHWFDQDIRVEKSALSYMFIINMSLLPTMLFFAFKQFAEGLSSTKPAMIITLVTNALNILLNYLLIYGKFGLPAMGLDGAGYATLIARFLMMGGIAWLVIANNPFRKYWKAIKWKRIQWDTFNRILKIGVPSGMQMVFEVGAFAGAAVMAGWISPQAQAAHNIAINLASISYMVATGLAAATTVRVGNQLGRRDIQSLRTAGFTGIKMVIWIMLIAGVLLFAGKDLLPKLYVTDETVIQIASSLLIVAVVFQLSDGIQVIGLGALRGLEDVKIPTFITLIAYWVFGLPVGYLAGIIGPFGVDGIWYGLASGLTVSAILLIWRFDRVTKKLKKRVKTNA